MENKKEMNYATHRVNMELFVKLDPEDFTHTVSEKWCEDYVEAAVFNNDKHWGLRTDFARAFLIDVDYKEIADQLNEMITENLKENGRK